MRAFESLVNRVPGASWLYAVDRSAVGEPHLHALVYGDVDCDKLRGLWVDGNRLRGRLRDRAADVSPLRGVGGLFYVSCKVVAHGDWMVSRSWPASGDVEGDLAISRVSRSGRPQRERHDAVAWLWSALRSGPRPERELRALCAAEAFSFETVRRFAKAALGVTSRRVGFGPGSRVEWALPSTGVPAHSL